MFHVLFFLYAVRFLRSRLYRFLTITRHPTCLITRETEVRCSYRLYVSQNLLILSPHSSYDFLLFLFIYNSKWGVEILPPFSHNSTAAHAFVAVVRHFLVHLSEVVPNCYHCNPCFLLSYIVLCARIYKLCCLLSLETTPETWLLKVSNCRVRKLHACVIGYEYCVGTERVSSYLGSELCIKFRVL